MRTDSRFYSWALLAILLLQFSLHLYIGTKIFFQDEQTYLSEADWVLKGLIPHRDFFLERPPGFIFFVFGIFLVLGKSMFAARMAMALVCMATTACVYLMGKKLFSPRTGLLAAALFAFTGPAYISFMVLSDSLIALFLALGFTVLIYNEGLDSKMIFLSGFILGANLTLRQSSIPMIFLAAFLLWRQCRSDARNRTAANLAVFFSGAILPCLLMVLLYVALGNLNELVYNSLFYSKGYLFSQMIDPFRENPLHYATIVSTWLFIPISFLLLFLFGRIANEQKTLFLAIMVISALPNVFPNFVANHLLPSNVGVSILAASIITESIKKKDLLPIAFVVFVVFMSATKLVLAGYMMFVSAPSTNLFGIPESVFLDSAGYINSHTSSEEKFLSFMHFPIYYLADRLPDSYFHYVDFFCSDETIEERIVSDLEKKGTKYVVLFRTDVSKVDRHTNIGFFCKGKLSTYLSENYHPEKVFLDQETKDSAVILRRN